MTRKDAVQFCMGYIVGAASMQSKRASTRDPKVVTVALKRAVATLKTRQQGFFNALERIVDEELVTAEFDGDPN